MGKSGDYISHRGRDGNACRYVTWKIVNRPGQMLKWMLMPKIVSDLT